MQTPKNEQSLENLFRDKGDLSPQTLENGDQPELISRRNSDIDSLLLQGLNLRFMGEKVGVSHETVRQYLIRTGQHEAWMRRKEKQKKERQEQLARLVSVLQGKLEKMVERGGFPCKKAFEYINKKNNSLNVDYVSLVLFFERYQKVMEAGGKLTLGQLGDGYFAATTAGKILKTVGLKPLHASFRRAVYSRDVFDGIERSFKLDMSAYDVAYFLGVPHYVVQKRFRERKRQKRAQFMAIHEGVMLTYRLASQIYHANDLGFTVDEISELVERPPDFIKSVIRDKKVIGPKIISELKVLYERDDINKPYKLEAKT